MTTRVLSLLCAQLHLQLTRVELRTPVSVNPRFVLRESMLWMKGLPAGPPAVPNNCVQQPRVAQCCTARRRRSSSSAANCWQP